MPWRRWIDTKAIGTREVVEVALTSGDKVTAFAYVMAPAHRHHLSGDGWNFDAFCRLDLPRYLRAR